MPAPHGLRREPVEPVDGQRPVDAGGVGTLHGGDDLVHLAVVERVQPTSGLATFVGHEVDTTQRGEDWGCWGVGVEKHRVTHGSYRLPRLGVRVDTYTRGMDDIMRRIAHIIDHEGFDGDGTLGQQVAQRIAPTLADVWDNGWNNGADYMADDGDALYLANNPFNAYRTEAERRRAVFEVMDLEDELEAQERRHAP